MSGSLNHLIKDCDFHDKKMVQKPVLNNVKKGTGQREVRPVWNNAMRVNHQNFSNSRRNFVPTAVLTKSGIVPVSTARPINTAAPKSFMNAANTRSNAFQKSHSPSRRPFFQQTTLKNRNLNNKVNTAKINSVNTTKRNKVTSAVGKQGINVVKSSACWADIILELKGYLINNGYADLVKMLYALTANPTIYVSLIKQFWQTATIKTVNNGEQQINVTVDGQTIAITKASVRRHLQLADADGISSLPNTEIFEQLTRMGYVSNGEHIPLFDSMLIHDQPGQGEGPTLTIESQHTPIASPTTSQPTTSQPMSSQKQPSQVPTTKPIITTSSPPLYETTIPYTTSSMPHDLPLLGGDTPRSDEGSKKLNELTELYIKLSDKVTSLEEDLKQTKNVYGKALTKLVKKVKYLEDKLKSTSVRRKARMVLSDDEEDLVSEDLSKKGRMTRQNMKKLTKILADASSERVKTYKRYTRRRRRSTVRSRDSTAGGLFSNAEEILTTDEKIAQKLNEEEMAKAVARKEQERIDFEKALELQKQLDKREETDHID
ncbi:hypothetical protein Tco_1465647 [Tanacetum coccineum]